LQNHALTAVTAPTLSHCSSLQVIKHKQTGIYPNVLETESVDGTEFEANFGMHRARKAIIQQQMPERKTEEHCNKIIYYSSSISILILEELTGIKNNKPVKKYAKTFALKQLIKLVFKHWTIQSPTGFAFAVNILISTVNIFSLPTRKTRVITAA
jgi:hypothetical protein